MNYASTANIEEVIKFIVLVTKLLKQTLAVNEIQITAL